MPPIVVSPGSSSGVWQSSYGSKGTAGRLRRHSWNDRTQPNEAVRGGGWNEEKESGESADSTATATSELLRVIQRTERRRHRTRHTIGDAKELRATITHAAAAAEAAAAQQQREVDERWEERKDKEADQRQSSRRKDAAEMDRQPLWWSRPQPELPTLHLFPPSPPSKHTVGPALDGNDDSSPATTAADDPESTAVLSDDGSVAADGGDGGDCSRRSGSYRAAVPSTTLSFSSQSESLLLPQHDQRYRHTAATIAAHHAAEEQQRATLTAAAVDGAMAASYSGLGSVASSNCCVPGPCIARCGDDLELLAAWRSVLDESERVTAHWSSEEEVAAGEAQFQAAVRSLVWRGIPHSIRQRAWLRLLRDKLPARDMDGYYALMHDRVRRAQQQHSEQRRRQAEGGDASFGQSTADSPLSCSFADIEKDVNRTLPSLWLFRTAEGVDRLRRVLLAYCVHCPLVGYCQGLNFIAGSLLLVCEGNEVAAFSLLAAMVDARSGYYSKSMAACMVDTHVLSDLCSYFEPELCALLSGHGLSLSNFCSSWLICLFCNTPLNVYDAFRVWDVLHVLGDEALFRCGLSLLRHAHSRIAAIRSSEELMLLFLQQLGDVQRIEPVLQHMHAEWRAEPLLAHSIAALREYHRYEITAEHSTLPASTVVRLSEKLSFSEDELQRLWQTFIRPDPWLTISTHCIQSLVHFRYSFCAAVFHPTTSALFKGRGLILPLNVHSNAGPTAAPAFSSRMPALAAEQGPSTEPAADAVLERSMAGLHELSAASAPPPTAGELSDLPSFGALPRSITAFYNPNDGDTCPHSAAEGDGPLTHSTSAEPTSPPTAARSSEPLSVSSSSSSSCSSTRGSRSFLSPLSHVVASPAGGGLRSLASTFVIPTAEQQDTDNIFAHSNSAANKSNNKHSRQASQRSDSHAAAHRQQQQQQQPDRAAADSQQWYHEVDAELSTFHAPSTSVPLSSPPLSPSSHSHSASKSAAQRVFAFALSASGASSYSPTGHKDKRTRSGLQPRTDGSKRSMAASPHSLPSSFSAHRALLSATTALSTAAPPLLAAATDYGRLTLQRSALSSSLVSFSSSGSSDSPWSAPSVLYSATTASTLRPLSQQAEIGFHSTTPITSSSSSTRLPSPLSVADEQHASSRPLLDAGIGGQPSHPQPASPSPPSVASSLGLMSVVAAGAGGTVGGSGSATSSVYACSENVLARLFSMLDGSSRGVVDFDEFCFGVCLFKRYPRSARLRAIFAMCDVAGEGMVSRADFAAFVGMFDRLYHGKRASDAELQAFVNAAFEKAAPSQFINCPLFEHIIPLHPAISTFFRLESASD